MKGTAFHERTKQLNLSTAWFGWGEYVIPDVYANVETELLAIRSSVAVIDMSPLPTFDIEGPDAIPMVNSLVTRNIDPHKIGRALFTPACNDEGKLICDGLVFILANNHVRYCSDNVFDWFQDHIDSFDVTLTDSTHDFGLLSLQGPCAKHVLDAVTKVPIEGLKFGGLAFEEIAGASVMVVRQGFTGALGYELWVDNSDGLAVWDAIMEAGAAFGIQPAGEYAADIARVEAGFPLISTDYAGSGPDPFSSNITVDLEHSASPYEMGFGQFVDLDKANFVGRQALLQLAKEPGKSKKIVGLEFDLSAVREVHSAKKLSPNISSRVRWSPLDVVLDGQTVGRATSVTWSPTTNSLIGFGHLPQELAKCGEVIRVLWRDECENELGLVTAKIVDMPFIQKGNRGQKL